MYLTLYLPYNFLLFFYSKYDYNVSLVSLYNQQRQLLKLSNICWDHLFTIKDIIYANAYTFFWADRIKQIQNAIRKIAPDIKGDWLRFHFEDKTITFSLSDEAIISYKPKIQEFSCFGSAVGILGTYEDYVRVIVNLSNKAIPKEMERFRNNYKGIVSKKTNSFIKCGVGRGTDFFKEVFDYQPNPAYKPGLEFLFQLRNIAVHNSGIVDQDLLNAANNPYVNINGGTLKIGMKLDWNLSFLLQLQLLMTEILPQVDPLVSAKLSLDQTEKKAFWYLDSGS
jgi:hypothetical protein